MRYGIKEVLSTVKLVSNITCVGTQGGFHARAILYHG